ncbi:SLC13 family permease [Halorhodospira sp. 9621]|uniref:SLC13 family permease n=1 Tax=Halorhodospira TaxID=85108 RepID=UPI001912B078|nr:MULTISPECIES: SLC13 family permease [Halorhodospira]MBK5944660.1 SLC13 family permease [Halorhodospira halophila]MCG5532576.1 SLC13 family permease [Halorhodospira sp. 9621]MCG5538065.1 SLC13 family permease [Halorhodospira sp. 9622]
MGWEAYLTAAVVVALLTTLITTRLAPDMAFLGAVTVLLVSGVIGPREAFEGLSNPGVLTVAALYVVVAGIRETGGVQWVSTRLLGRPRSLLDAQRRLTLPVAGFSAFLNNTPVVAMLIPAVGDWARKHNLAESKLLLPLSYAAMLGGTCTLIGTSTNLVVNGALEQRTGEGLMLFELAWVGIPVLIVGLAFMFATSRWLLPDRRPAAETLEDPREYTVEMIVEPSGPLVGRTIERAGLRHLPGCYLMEIDRGGEILPAVSPREKLRAGDRLVFVGVVDSVVELQKIRGLQPATDQVFKLDGRRSDRRLVEVVVSETCPVANRTVRDGRFRTRYDAVVIAVARNGERVDGKIGDIVLRPGDTLLIEAGEGFVERQRNARDFLLVRGIEGSAVPRHDRAWLALGILGVMLGVVGVGWLSMLEGALAAGAALLATRCMTLNAARQSVDWSVILTIAAAFGIGAAMDQTGLAAVIAGGLLQLAGEVPWLNLAVVYLVTVLFTSVITNNAAAVLMVPIAASVAADLSVSVVPFAVAIMLAASASFATPMGYQTNLMVYGPGGYHFTDYLRAGLPLNLVTGAVALAVIPWVWPF